LKDNAGTLSLTLNLDKSTAKIAWWMIVLLIMLVFLMGAVTAMLYVAQREYRLYTMAVDERRMENRSAWRSLGIDGLALEDHDISRLLDEVRKRYPEKEPQ
jgi:hypothetical protein